MRKGMGKGTGKGYKNLVGTDKRIHSMSARGIKQPQKMNPVLSKPKLYDELYREKYFNISVSRDYKDGKWVEGYAIFFKHSLGIKTGFKKTLKGAIKYGQSKVKNIRDISEIKKIINF